MSFHFLDYPFQGKSNDILLALMNCYNNTALLYSITLRFSGSRFLKSLVGYCKPGRIVAGSDAEEEDEKDGKEEEDGPSASSLEAILRDARYQLQVTLMASSRGLKAGHQFKVKCQVWLKSLLVFQSLTGRNDKDELMANLIANTYFHDSSCINPWGWNRMILSWCVFPCQVKPISVVFEPSTVYGAREGFHSALLVTSCDKANVLRKSQLWKYGVVQNVSMLPRLLGCH